MKNVCILIFVLLIGNFSVAQSSLDTLLLSAVKSNNFDSVQLLVEQGANVNFCDSNQAPIVMWAALKGDLEMVKYLVKKGADVKKKGLIWDDTYGSFIYGNIVGIAAARKDITMLKYLVEECGIPYDDKELDISRQETGWNILGYAVQPSIMDTTIAIYYIMKNTFLNPIELYSLSTYFNCNYDSLVLKRINRKKNRKEQLVQINLLLEKAIINNHVDLINKLLGFDPELNFLNSDSLSPLALSIVLNKPDIIKLLLENGANPDQGCKSQKTALFFAIDIDNIELFDELIQYGANIDHQDCMGRTPLFYSLLQNRIKIAKRLLKAGADPTIFTNDNDNIFRLTRDREHAEIVHMLNKTKEYDRIQARTFHPKLSLPTSQSGSYKLLTSPDDQYILGLNGGVYYLWDSQTGRKIRQLNNIDKNPLFPVVFYSDHSLIYLSSDANIVFWDIEREEITREIPLPDFENIEILPISNHAIIELENYDTTISRILGSIRDDGFISRGKSEQFELINIFNNKKLNRYQGYYLGSSQNGKYIASTLFSQDSILIWDSEEYNTIHWKIKKDPFRFYHSANITKNGQWIILVYTDRNPSLYSSPISGVIIYNKRSLGKWDYPKRNRNQINVKFSSSDSAIYLP